MHPFLDIREGKGMAHLKMNVVCARSCTAKEHYTKLGLFKGKFGVNSGV